VDREWVYRNGIGDVPKHLPDASDINQVNENGSDMDMAGQQIQQSCWPGFDSTFPCSLGHTEICELQLARIKKGKSWGSGWRWGVFPALGKGKVFGVELTSISVNCRRCCRRRWLLLPCRRCSCSCLSCYFTKFSLNFKNCIQSLQKAGISRWDQSHVKIVHS